MAIPLSSLSGSNNGLNGLGSAELASRVNSALLSKNAGVQKINADLERDQTKLSGLGQLSNALATFQAVAQSLGKGGLQTAATASNPAVLTGVTAGGAKAGNYQVEVKQLAQGQQLSSRAQQTSNGAIGSGAATTIKVDVGTTNGSNFSVGSKTSVSITIDASNNSLGGIASAFKAAGIDASVAHTGDGYRLVINGKSGSGESLRISVGGDAALQKLLAYSSTGSKNLEQAKVAQDAKLVVDGKAITSDSNVVTGAIKGTALALTKVGSTSVTVSQQDSQTGKNVELFVKAYNRLNDTIKTLQQDGLKGDGTAAQLTQQLSQLIDGTTQSALAAAGVTRGSGGALQVDKKKLDAAVVADAAGVGKLFINNGGGLAEKLAGKIDQFLGAKGSLQKQATAIDRDISTLTQKKTSLTQALTAQSSSLLSQYTDNGTSALPGLTGGGKSLFDFIA
jgi:flagellar hook-associated protein 2